MTIPVRSLVTLAFAAAFAFPTAHAQTPAADAPAKPLAQNEKKFVKDAAEQMIAEIHLVEITRHAGPGSEALKKSNEKINKELGDAWGELAKVADANKLEYPKTDVTPSEKTNIAKLKKLEGDKFDKGFLKALSKETKRTAQIFATAGKGVQNPELKAYIEKWAPTITSHNEEVEQAEDAAKKAKSPVALPVYYFRQAQHSAAPVSFLTRPGRLHNASHQV
jgi:predicted outer membrane protein